jgi:hypothetical protein
MKTTTKEEYEIIDIKSDIIYPKTYTNQNISKKQKNTVKRDTKKTTKQKSQNLTKIPLPVSLSYYEKKRKKQ